MTSGICCDVQRITQPLAKTTNKGRPLFFSILEYTHEWMPINLTKDVLSSEKSMLKANEEFLIWGQIHISCIPNTLLYSLSSFWLQRWHCDCMKMSIFSTTCESSSSLSILFKFSVCCFYVHVTMSQSDTTHSPTKLKSYNSLIFILYILYFFIVYVFYLYFCQTFQIQTRSKM